MATMLDPRNAIRTFFFITTSSMIVLNNVPAIRDVLFPYGVRTPDLKQSQPSKSEDAKSVKKNTEPERTSILSRIMQVFASVQVPHTWFYHYYLFSVCSSLFWAYQIITHGTAFRLVAEYVPYSAKSMSLQQVALTWTLVLIQGSRRLYEQIAFTKPSQSKMGFMHYSLGMAYYLCVGMAAWIDGIPVLRETEFTFHTLCSLPAPPTLRTFVSIPIFLLASGMQHDCHEYLASLKKYTVPVHPFFRAFVSPHYTAEMLIYTALTIISAPKGDLVNYTFLSVLAFVVVNLSTTATGTKKWYISKFGPQSVEGKWITIPFLY